MVAVKSYEADRFLNTLSPHIALYLVCGSEPGLISERIQRLTGSYLGKPQNALQIIRLAGDAIADDPSILLNEAFAISMFGERQLIRIELGRKQIVSVVENLLKNPPEACLLVIEAGAIKADTAIRKLVDKAKNAATIECYPDSDQDIDRLLRATIADANKAINDDTRAFLAERLCANRIANRDEIEKLLLYTHGKNKISIQDIIDIVANDAPQVSDDAYTAALMGNITALETVFQNDAINKMDPNQTIAGLIRHLLALQAARVSFDHGRSLNELAQQLARISGGMARKSVIEQQIRRLNLASLDRALQWAQEASISIRRQPDLASMVLTHLFWRIIYLHS